MGQRRRWLGEAGGIGEAGAGGVDPGDAGDEVGVFGVAAEGGQEHRWAGAGAGRGLLPDPLAGQGRANQRHHVGGAVGALAPPFALRGDSHLRQRAQRRSALFRRT